MQTKPNRWIRERTALRKIRVVIAAGPRPLVRAVEHLLTGQEDVQIVSRSSQLQHLLMYASALQPDLIVAHSRLMGTEVCQTIAEIRRRSPGCKLILVACPFEDPQTVADCGADADLEEDALVASLPPLVRKVLSRSKQDASSGPTIGAFRNPDQKERNKA
jgi:DNA-binding NarL/FixJ family response regulator